MRPSPPRLPPPLTALLCGACVAVYAFLALAPREAADALLARLGDTSLARVRAGALAPLVTSLFVHVEAASLAFNVLLLARFAGALERAGGTRRLAAVALAAALVTSGAELAATGSTGIGISGLVYACAGVAWGAAHRDPRLARAASPPALAALGAVLLGGLALEAATGRDIGNAAHASGIVLGAAIAPLWRVSAPRASRPAARSPR